MSAIPLNRPKIQTFGGLKVLGAERTVSQFSQRRSALLLARLALARGRPVSRESLAELLWPGEETDRTLQRLRQALVTLRESLNRAETGLAEAIRSERLVLTLDLGAVDLDLVLFESDLRHARGGSDLEAFRSALSHAEGEFLEDYHTDWIDAERWSLRTQVRDAALDLARLLASNRDPGSVRLLLQQLQRDPLDEQVMAALLTHAQGTGHVYDALRCYAEFERNLRRNLGIAPSEAIRRLADGLRQEGPTPSNASPAPLPTPNAELPIAVWAQIPGTFTKETAAVACNRFDAIALLAAAVDLGWVEVTSADPVLRYRVTVTQLASDAQLEARQRLITHARRMLDEANLPGLRGLRGIWGERLIEEIPLITAAFRWAAERGDFSAATHLAIASRRAMTYSGNLADAKHLAEEALRFPSLDPLVRSELLIHRARLHLSAGDYQASLADLREARANSAHFPPSVQAMWCYALALLAHYKGLARAEGRFAKESSDWYEEAGLPVESLDARMVLGLNLQKRGLFAAARAEFREALNRADVLGDDLGVGISLHHQAQLAADTGDRAEANRLLEASLRVFRLSGDTLGEAWVRKSLAIHASLDDRAEDAHSHLQSAIPLVRRHRDAAGIVSCHEISALIHWQDGEPAQALQAISVAAEAAQEANMDFPLGELALLAAAILSERDQFAPAARAYGMGRRLDARSVPRYTGYRDRGNAAIAQLVKHLGQADLAVEVERGSMVPRRLMPEELRSLTAYL